MGCLENFGSMRNTLSIVGVTGSGKTAFAVRTAKQLLLENVYTHIALISADSRQVYRGLEITSGADIPADFKRVAAKQPAVYDYFAHKELAITLHGVSIVPPTTNWSIGHFRELVAAVKKQHVGSAVACLIVGGTGLYHRWIYQDANWKSSPADPELREDLSSLSLTQLQQRLQTSAADWWQSLNDSDQQNPRRLIRAIEHARAGVAPWTEQKTHAVRWLGLADDLGGRAARIKHRVQERIQSGAVREVERLQELELDAALPAWSTIGVPQLRAFLSGKASQAATVEAWTTAEVQYCKQQLTWLKRETVLWVLPENQAAFLPAYAQAVQLLTE